MIANNLRHSALHTARNIYTKPSTHRILRSVLRNQFSHESFTVQTFYSSMPRIRTFATVAPSDMSIVDKHQSEKDTKFNALGDDLIARIRKDFEVSASVSPFQNVPEGEHSLCQFFYGTNL